MKEKVETLAEYVTRVIKEKRLKQEEVCRQSRGHITDGYIRGIMKGKARNLSVEKLKALALGLGVPEDELFRVARGLPAFDRVGQPEELTYCSIIRLVGDSAKYRVVADLLREAAKLTPEKQEEALSLLKTLNSRRRIGSRSLARR
jgi:transcriptional regulator with XRE-family HTH domain